MSDVARTLLDFLNDMVEALCNKLAPVLGARPKEVKLGLGVALGLIALHRLLSAPPKPSDGEAVARAASGGGAAAGHAGVSGQATEPAEASTTSSADRLKGVGRVTLATQGVLFSGGSREVPQATAAIAADAADALKQIAKSAEVYLITQVGSDDAEKAVMAALQAAGVVGSGCGCVPAHKVLFCSTDIGRIALVRQITPDLHVDASADIVKELARFGTRLLHVVGPGNTSPVPTVASAGCLASYISST